MFKLNRSSSAYINDRYSRLGFTQMLDDNKWMAVNLNGPDETLVASMANAIRRTIIQELPIWAPGQVTILNNTTDYHPDVLIQRIHFLTVNQQVLESLKESPKDLSFHFTVDLPVETTNPGHHKIYLWDYLASNNKEASELLQQLFPHNSLICTMKPGQKLDMTFNLEQGQGQQHAKWTAGFSSFQPMSKNPIIYQIVIESYGKWPANKLLSLALEAIKGKLRALAEYIKTIPPDDSLSRNKVKIWKLDRQDDTLGSLYQSLLFIQPLVKQNPQQSVVTYKIPHPLDQETQLWCRLPEGNDEQQFIVQTLTKSAQDLYVF